MSTETDVAIELEMDWTPYGESCRDPLVLAHSGTELRTRLCRRRLGHGERGKEDHASGHGSDFLRWTD